MVLDSPHPGCGDGAFSGQHGWSRNPWMPRKYRVRIPSEAVDEEQVEESSQEALQAVLRTNSRTKDRWRGCQQTSQAEVRPSIEHWIVAFSDETTTGATVSRED